MVLNPPASGSNVRIISTILPKSIKPPPAGSPAVASSRPLDLRPSQLFAVARVKLLFYNRRDRFIVPACQYPPVRQCVGSWIRDPVSSRGSYREEYRETNSWANRPKLAALEFYVSPPSSLCSAVRRPLRSRLCDCAQHSRSSAGWSGISRRCEANGPISDADGQRSN